MRSASALVTAALLFGLAAATGCRGRVDELTAYGEALFVVDTDLPVPQLAGRLRVDLYAEDGTWFESRDIGRADPRDWPASFSVYSDDATRTKRVLVRLRTYPEGSVRGYTGERFADRAPFEPPPVASSLDALCATAPELPVGARLTMRRGGEALTEIVAQGSCSPPTASGSVAARVTITTPGTYRFDVAALDPVYAETTLFLRSRCGDPSSQLACGGAAGASQFSSGHLPRFDATLGAGNYFLMTGGALPDFPADVTLEVLPIDTPLPPGGEPPEAQEPSTPPPPAPRLVGASESTPTTEPVPTATIDRLVRVALEPGARGRVRVTLHAACAGTMARLGADPTVPDPLTATTCVDDGGARVPVVDAPMDADLSRDLPSVQGSAAATAPCELAPPSLAAAVCIPGGLFLFGARIVTDALGTKTDDSPERIARVAPFWMDRYEVTVGKFRDALARGLVAPPRSFTTNDVDVLPAGPRTLDKFCPFSAQPSGREDYGMACLSWSLARAFCRMQGGDLPTEVQWEYAAAAQGRPFKTLYPWGDDDPTCDRAVFARNARGFGPSDCVKQDGSVTPATGPMPVTTKDGSDGAPGDVSPAGVVGLEGGLEEWTRDAAGRYDGPCWSATGLDDPSCDEREALERSVRGGSFVDTPVEATARSAWPSVVAGSGALDGAIVPLAMVGFRCVYPARPAP